MTEVSLVRLWVMRAFYALMAFGAGAMVWPLILSHPAQTAHMTGVAWARPTAAASGPPPPTTGTARIPSAAARTSGA